MNILVTGFDPFDNETINPAYEAVKQLPQMIGNFNIIKLEIPTVFHQSLKVLEEAIDKYKPRLVMCIGQAGGSDHIAIERIAINCDDARIPDNKGNQPIDETIIIGADTAYITELPIKSITENINKEGISAKVSNSAGTFVCNHLYFGLLHYICEKDDIKGGFIHVPYIPEQVLGKDLPSMKLEDITKAIEIAIMTSLESNGDIKISGGTIY